MLSWLLGKKRARREPDKVFVTREVKTAYLLAQENVRLVVHFVATRRDLQARARAEGKTLSVTLASDLGDVGQHDPNLAILVAERHPSRAHDERICSWADTAAGSIAFVVALDDVVLSPFVGSMRSLFEKLGVDESQPIESAMVSRSIQSAQEKLAKNATGDLPADSAEAWLRANCPS